MFVLSIINPPTNGAAYGTAEVSSPVPNVVDAGGLAYNVMVGKARQFLTWGNADRYRNELVSLTIRNGGHAALAVPSGHAFRIDSAENAPHACPCDGCGRLVLTNETPLVDAYCDGCYTWGDDTKISCSPHRSAHANPWTTSPKDALFVMEVTIDHGDETGHDVRYSKTDDFDGLWDYTENALIAWPGLTAEQIIEVTIAEIDREN